MGSESTLQSTLPRSSGSDSGRRGLLLLGYLLRRPDVGGAAEGQLGLELQHDVVREAGHLLELPEGIDAAVRGAPFDDRLGLRAVEALHPQQLALLSGIHV